MRTAPRSLPVLLAALFAAPALAQTPRDFVTDDVYWDTLDAQGNLTGGRVQMVVPRRGSVTGVIPAPVTTLNSPLSLLPPNNHNRMDLVIVGDGYQSGQLATYASQVATIASTFFNKEPYTTYEPLFLVHRVDVVSVDSGVDNDPTQGIQRNTAMDMGYWCNGIDRLLCVDVTRAYQYANNAPDVDLVLALANSTTYGGAGYPVDQLATSAAANGSALEIVRHEFGHALGNLADEYDYGGPVVYPGPEPNNPDVSMLTSAAMQSAMTKWYRWLGVNDLNFDGLVSTYLGADYSQQNIYRPTNNSLMRNLGRPFNLPSAEAIILQIYHTVHPIDDASPTNQTLDGSETLYVTPVAPAGNPLSIQWSKNGVAIPGATGTTLNLATIGIGSCTSTVSVTVKDNTTMVKDEAARTQWMTESRTWQVVPTSAFTNFCPVTPNSAGSGAILVHTGSNSIATNNLEIVALGCPSFVNGIFFYGTAQTQVVLGNGFRCAGGSLVRFPVTQTNLFGDATLDLNVSALPNGAQIHAGDSRYFQFWFRDAAGGGAATDLSDALAVQFCP